MEWIIREVTPVICDRVKGAIQCWNYFNQVPPNLFEEIYRWLGLELNEVIHGESEDASEDASEEREVLATFDSIRVVNIDQHPDGSGAT